MGLCRERGARMSSGLRVVREIAGEGGRTIASVSASQWSAGPEEWWAGWAGTAGIIPPPRGEEGFRSESAETRGLRAELRNARSGDASCLKKAAAYFAKGVQK